MCENRGLLEYEVTMVSRYIRVPTSEGPMSTRKH